MLSRYRMRRASWGLYYTRTPHNEGKARRHSTKWGTLLRRVSVSSHYGEGYLSTHYGEGYLNTHYGEGYLNTHYGEGYLSTHYGEGYLSTHYGEEYLSTHYGEGYLNTHSREGIHKHVSYLFSPPCLIHSSFC